MTLIDAAGLLAGLLLLTALLTVWAAIGLGCAILVVRVISERGRR